MKNRFTKPAIFHTSVSASTDTFFGSVGIYQGHFAPDTIFSRGAYTRQSLSSRCQAQNADGLVWIRRILQFDSSHVSSGGLLGTAFTAHCLGVLVNKALPVGQRLSRPVLLLIPNDPHLSANSQHGVVSSRKTYTLSVHIGLKLQLGAQF